MDLQAFERARRRAAAAGVAEPAAWLVQNADLLPDAGTALDVACGSGRHALLLAAAGLSVRAVDRDPGRTGAVAAEASRLGLRVEAQPADLEAAAVDLGDAAYDLVLVVRYLHRPLFPALVRCLRPGGLLVYETFTEEQALRGRPKNPAFLLARGELPRLAAPLDVLRAREGEFEGGCVAGIVARRVSTRRPK